MEVDSPSSLCLHNRTVSTSNLQVIFRMIRFPFHNCPDDVKTSEIPYYKGPEEVEDLPWS